MTRTLVISLSLMVLSVPVRLEAQAIRGRVFDRETGAPIDGAQVAIAKLARTTQTNERGEFRLSELPAGAHDIQVRRLGYRELTIAVTVPDKRDVDREIILSRVTTLDTVAVTASAVIPSFEDNRRIGLGRFLTRADLEKQENRKLAEILEQVGAKALRNGGRAWIGGGHGGQRSIMNRGGTKCSVLEGRETAPAAGCGCFAQVYLNDALIYNGEARAIVPDVNSIPPSSIEAIEFYKGPAQTPLKYSRLNSECGVLVLHTRRDPGTAGERKP